MVERLRDGTRGGKQEGKIVRGGMGRGVGAGEREG